MSSKKQGLQTSPPGTLLSEIRKHSYFYLLLFPALLYYLIFHYVPIYGIILAFKDFNFMKGIIRSPWIGLANFREIFQLRDFWRAFRNTILIAFYRLIFEFPAPVILAVLINELRQRRLKGVLQTVYTFPHFLSWIVISGIMINLFRNDGAVNLILQNLGLGKTTVLTNPYTFRFFLNFSNLWREIGWGTIIYLAALSGINPELYEAAEIDGAGRMQRILHITWPGIKSTVVILLILFLGTVMNSGGGGFAQIFNLYNAAVYETADIIDTYIYRRTFVRGASFGTSTAVGLFKSLINFALILMANRAANRLSEGGGIF